MTTNSKAQQDNTALFLSCAQEWANSEDHKENSLLESSLLKKNLLEKNTSQVETKQNNTEKSSFIVLPTMNNDNAEQYMNINKENQEAIFKQIPQKCITKKTSKKITEETTSASKILPTSLSTHFPHFYSYLHTKLQNAAPYSLTQSKTHALTLLKTPHESLNWHLYLIPAQKQIPSQSERASIIQEESLYKEELCQPITKEENLLAWLHEGITKGWLRHAALEEFKEILPSAYLSQDIFWKRFSSKCDSTNRISLVLFKLPKQNTNSLHSNKQDIYLRELIEQILLTIKGTDFFGEIHGFGVGLVLCDCGSFSATAKAERILTRLENIFKNTNSTKNPQVPSFSTSEPHTNPNMQIPIQVAVAEKEEGENADTLFAHAKEVIHAHEHENTYLAHSPQQNSFIPPRKKATKNTMDTTFSENQNPIPPRIQALRVHVYRNTQKSKEKNSLVQSDEKRFLFFGIH